MVVTFKNSNLDFHIEAPPSKSIYHRELIVSFLCGNYEHLECLEGDSDDIKATKDILRSLHEVMEGNVPEGKIDGDGFLHLFCNESGSTLRLLIPIVAALFLGEGRERYGLSGLVFETAGRLFDRPIDELQEAVKPHGLMVVKNSETRSIKVTGEMTSGEYFIDGSRSSQSISGLLIALSILDKPSSVNVISEMSSKYYIGLTEHTLEKYGCPVERDGKSFYPKAGSLAGNDKNRVIPEFKVEGDWSNGAFLLCMKRWSGITVGNLYSDSRQGDRAIVDFLELVDSDDSPAEVTWDCSDIPDITPYMAMVAPFEFAKITFTGISRLRIKESDRVKATREMLSAIGVRTEETDDTLTVYEYESPSNKELEEPIKLSSYHDHRMAMCAILLSVILKKKVDIDDIWCIRKSYPEFLELLDISE